MRNLMMLGTKKTSKSNASRKLRISFNSKLIDKIPPQDKRHYTEGFETYEFSIQEFAKIVSKGCAFSYDFNDNVRKTENFLAADILCADMDGGRTIEDTLDDPIVKSYGSFYYTTPSHSADGDRFRVVFILPRTITDPNELRCAMTSLARRLGGDPSVTDPARMFYGSTNCRHKLLANSLTDEYLAELITDGQVVPTRESITGNIATANRSDLQLKPTTNIKLHDGSIIELGEIDKKVSVHCPFHNDKNASAFVALNQHRNRYLHCSKCQLTWWQKSAPPRYDFNDFENVVVGLKKQTSTREATSPKQGIERFLESGSKVTIEARHVEVQNQRYSSLASLPAGLNFIKSPKGTGKTTLIANDVREYIRVDPDGHYKPNDPVRKYSNSEGDTEFPFYHPDRSVLLIGHRKALIGSLCDKLDLNCYLNDKNHEKHRLDEIRNRYGVCLDSLWKVEGRTYDWVIIDESEQVLSHFLSATIGSRRDSLFANFSALLRKASKVVLLDADLGWITFDTIISIFMEKMIRKTGEHDEALPPELPITIFVNQYKPPEKNINVYGNRDHLINDLIESVVSKKRVFVTSNSKAQIKRLDEILGTIESKNNITIKRIVVTSENSTSKPIKSFISNIETEILNYDVVLTSPSLGTGIDITFQNDSQEIDIVYGIFADRINTHFDIDQQLGRVRNPKDINVWVSGKVYNFETEFGVVQADMQALFLQDLSHNNFNIQTNQTAYEIRPFLIMAAQIVASQRHSKNNLKKHFIQYKRDQSYYINYKEFDQISSKKGKELNDAASMVVLEKQVHRIANAKQLNLYYFQKLEDAKNHLNISIPLSFLDRYHRTKIELFYCEAITEDLVREDGNGSFRKQISLYRKVVDSAANNNTFDAIKNNESTDGTSLELKTCKKFAYGSYLISTVLKCTPIFDGENFNPDIEVSSHDLNEFVKAYKALAIYFEGQFDLEQRADIDKKPMQQLNEILEFLGLMMVRARVKVINKTKYYFYQLDEQSLTRVEAVPRQHSIDRLAA
tara:strand:- start:6 stop:3062 length:3057 start_codon:yes stop_codon:yes gene_type:complete